MRFGILGPLRVGDDVLAHRLAPRERRVLAALLLAGGRTVTVDQLIDAVWDDDPPSTALRQIQNCLSALRRRVPDVLPAGGRGYRLELDGGQLDARIFADMVAAARSLADDDRVDAAVERLRSALALWRGPALADCPGRLVEAAAARLNEQRLAATELCLELELRRGGHVEVVAELTELVASHPLRERLVGQLMLALHRSGRRADALAAYQRLRSRLAAEIGLDPGPELRELHVAILRSDTGAPRPTTTPHVPRQLPAPVRHFVGRGRELEELTRLGDEAATTGGALVISAIDGSGGIGKTAIALHWAHRMAPRFPDGQLYVNLRGFDPGGSPVAPAQAIRGFLDAFGVPARRMPAGLDAQAALYRSLVAGRRVLLVLDNASDVDQVRPLLPGSPTCLVLVTSRSALTGLVAVEGAYPITLDLLPHDDAHELLARHVGAERLASDPAAVDAIVTRCARLPLALGIVAARAAARPASPLSVFAAELTDARGRLDALDGGDRATQVRAVFSWSYERLSPPAARLFRLLGLHPGPDVTAAAAASLAGSPAEALLVELIRAHVVVEHLPGRYTLHDLLRAYATEQARRVDTAAEQTAATGRILDHYLHTAYAADRLLEPHQEVLTPAAPTAGTSPEPLEDAEAALDWFAAEHAVLLAVVDQAAEAGWDSHVWQLARVLRNYLHRLGRWHDLAATQHAALTAARRLADPAAQALTHRALAYASMLLGRSDDAHTHLRQALDLSEQMGDVAQQAHNHLGLAEIEGKRGRHAAALDHARQALALYRAGDLRNRQGNALNDIGWHLIALGDHREALASSEEALRVHLEVGDEQGQADAWHNLGYAHHHLGDHDRAAECYRRAVDLSRARHDRYHLAVALTHLGDTHRAAGCPDAARTAWREALDILDEIDHPDADGLRTRLDGGVGTDRGELRH